MLLKSTKIGKKKCVIDDFLFRDMIFLIPCHGRRNYISRAWRVRTIFLGKKAYICNIFVTYYIHVCIVYTYAYHTYIAYARNIFLKFSKVPKVQIIEKYTCILKSLLISTYYSLSLGLRAEIGLSIPVLLFS